MKFEFAIFGMISMVISTIGFLINLVRPLHIASYEPATIAMFSCFMLVGCLFTLPLLFSTDE